MLEGNGFNDRLEVLGAALWCDGLREQHEQIRGLAVQLDEAVTGPLNRGLDDITRQALVEAIAAFQLPYMRYVQRLESAFYAEADKHLALEDDRRLCALYDALHHSEAQHYSMATEAF